MCELPHNQSYLPPLLDITLFTTACISGLLSEFSCQHEVISVRSFSGISKEDDRRGLYGGSSLPLTLLITAITCIITIKQQNIQAFDEPAACLADGVKAILWVYFLGNFVF